MLPRRESRRALEGCTLVDSDRRLTNQESYLHSVRLVRRPWRQRSPTWDHDHCEFCWAKFSLAPDDLGEGYCTEDEYHWVCETCIHDFRDRFK